MRRMLVNWLSVFALLALPMAGCSSSTTEDAGGDGGEGGMGGSAGVGGEAGAGGEAGSGGEAATGIWTGTGDGADGTFFICFNVNEDGSALVRPIDASNECMGWSVWVEFDGCEGGFMTDEEVPISDGSFRLLREEGGLAGFWDVSGTFDGNSASGDAEVAAFPEGTCAGAWTASPAE